MSSYGYGSSYHQSGYESSPQGSASGGSASGGGGGSGAFAATTQAQAAAWAQYYAQQAQAAVAGSPGGQRSAYDNYCGYQSGYGSQQRLDGGGGGGGGGYGASSGSRGYSTAGYANTGPNQSTIATDRTTASHGGDGGGGGYGSGTMSMNQGLYNMDKYSKYDGKRHAADYQSGPGKKRFKDDGEEASGYKYREEASGYANREEAGGHANREEAGGYANREEAGGYANSPPRERRTRLDDGIPRKDDHRIPVDKILCNPKFNFWNLPAKARVLLVSNIPKHLARPRALFNVFGFFGDVLKVKILRNKLNAALVEFTTATFAMIARNFMDGFEINGQKLALSFSRFDRVRLPNEIGLGNDGYTQDFSLPEFNNLHRYNRDDLKKINLKRLCEPTVTLHVGNVPEDHTADKIKDLFVVQGLDVTDCTGIPTVKKGGGAGIPTAKKGGGGKDVPTKTILMVFVDFSTASDACLGLALVAGALESLANPQGLRISFSPTTAADERKKKAEADAKAAAKVADREHKQDDYAA